MRLRLLTNTKGIPAVQPGEILALVGIREAQHACTRRDEANQQHKALSCFDDSWPDLEECLQPLLHSPRNMHVHMPAR